MNNYNNWNIRWIPQPNIYPLMNQTNTKNETLYNPKEGFEKGNMFTDLYSPYKNFQPEKLVPKNEQEQLLLELQEVSFAAHELNLYLDLHPEDQSMGTLFKDYQRKKEELTKAYEELYGPMTVYSNNIEDTSKWVNTSWPWEGYNV